MKVAVLRVRLRHHVREKDGLRKQLPDRTELTTDPNRHAAISFGTCIRDQAMRRTAELPMHRVMTDSRLACARMRDRSRGRASVDDYTWTAGDAGSAAPLRGAFFSRDTRDGHVYREITFSGEVNPVRVKKTRQSKSRIRR